ncbi:hypothetical protein RBWH47_01982 [Rhodopirellula baltica WH47]|uniref:Uncharacterized protein n=1 Tax=Rhodopirellula baltica WH47 TaxID=991778 RepID=F2AVR5_RHOBT|nr:hypothetical protein RBWH47_01982 [Rhodopirellula baltica WH47]
MLANPLIAIDDESVFRRIKRHLGPSDSKEVPPPFLHLIGIDASVKPQQTSRMLVTKRAACHLGNSTHRG